MTNEHDRLSNVKDVPFALVWALPVQNKNTEMDVLYFLCLKKFLIREEEKKREKKKKKIECIDRIGYQKFFNGNGTSFSY